MNRSLHASSASRNIRFAVALGVMSLTPIAWAAQLTLTWSDNSDNETGFKIERSTDGADFAQVVSVGANIETHTDTDLSANTTYWYRVRSYNSAGNSGYSNPASATTPGAGGGAVPTPTIVFPSAGVVLPVGEAIRVDATLNGETTSIARVEFFAGTTKVGESTSEPWSVSWTGASVGIYILTARAINLDGASATSAGVTISVDSASGFDYELPGGGRIRLVAQDIGQVGNAGSTSFNSETGKFTIETGGIDIWNEADGFHFIWTEVTGDFLVSTQVESLTESNPFAKAGIMIRESLHPESIHALAHANANGANLFTRRVIEGESTSTIAAPVSGTPIWLRLERSGAVVSAFYSADGVDWLPFGSQDLELSQSVYVGIAVTAHTVSDSTTARLSDFDLVMQNEPPLAVSLLEPSEGSVFELGESITVSAAVSEPPLTSRIELLADGTVIGQDTSAPYLFLWSGAEAGAHTIQARAVDMNGGAFLSDLVSVSVQDSSNPIDPPSFGAYRGAFTIPATGADEGITSGASEQETGRFSVWIDADGSMRFLGFDASTGAAFSILEVELAGDGLFVVVGLSGGEPVTIRGRIDAKGIVGTVDGTDLILSGSAVDEDGPSGAAVGFYEAVGVRTPDTCLMTIVGADGLGFMTVSRDGFVKGAEVSVLMTETGAYLTSDSLGAELTLDIGAGTAQGVMTVEGGQEIWLMGVRSDIVALRRLENISTRGSIASGGGFMIMGFVVSGTEPKDVLIRAIGPGLTAFGVANAVQDPVLKLVSDSGTIATNSRWIVGSVIETVSAYVGAFPLDRNSLDSVLHVTVAPGRYSAVVSDAFGQGGNTLIEIYDATESGSAGSDLTNLSTRGSVGSDGYLVGGFVVSGNTPKRVLIRAVGPGLEDFGVGNALPETKLILTQRADGGDVTIGENIGWFSQQNADGIAEAASNAGAFELEPNSQDSAILLWLEPGIYTATVQPGSQGLSGTALVEVYQTD